MRFFGFELSRTKEKSLESVGGALSRGWKRLIHEPFTGAWQRNMEEVREIPIYPTLYACLMRISTDIGKLPFRLASKDSKGIWKEVTNPAYSPVLRKPNHYQTAQQFREAWMLSKLMHGNAYILKERDQRGIVVRMYVLDPCRVEPLVSDSGAVFYRLCGDKLNGVPDQLGDLERTFPASEIIHDRYMTMHHWLIGVPPLCAANWPAVKNLRILKTSSEFFDNSAQPGGILTAPAGMSEEDAQAVSEFFQRNSTGVNAGRVAVIGADMKFTPMRMNSADAQLVEQMRYSDEQICQPFGIMPFKIGIGTIPAGLKVDDINQMYHSDALQAHIEAMEYLLDEALGVSAPMGVELDTEPLLRMDEEKRAAVWGGLTGSGIASPNEARFKFNLAPLEGGDTVYMQQQDYPLDQVRLNKIQQEQPAPAPATTPEQEEQAQQEQERQFMAGIVKALAEVN